VATTKSTGRAGGKTTTTGAAEEPTLADLARRIEVLESEKQISKLNFRYVWLADVPKDADAIAECFTENAIWEGVGEFDEYLSTGRQEIRELFRDVPNQLPFTAHFVTNEVIEIAPDGDHAHGQWHILEMATLRDNCAQVWLVAWYENDFERVDGQWLISHVRLVNTFVAPYEEGWLKTKYVSPITLTKISRI
jgi:ketosteroid isomerase-like protein